MIGCLSLARETFDIKFANNKLVNSSMTIGGNQVSLGGTVTADDIATSISAGTITNAQLAGSIGNEKLVNKSVKIAGTDVDLGAEITAATLASALDVNVAPTFATAADTNIGVVENGHTPTQFDANLTTVAATDADGDSLTHSIC